MFLVFTHFQKFIFIDLHSGTVITSLADINVIVQLVMIWGDILQKLFNVCHLLCWYMAINWLWKGPGPEVRHFHCQPYWSCSFQHIYSRIYLVCILENSIRLSSIIERCFLQKHYSENKDQHKIPLSKLKLISGQCQCICFVSDYQAQSTSMISICQ